MATNFVNGFETGDLSGMNDTSGTFSVQATTVHAGGYAAQLSALKAAESWVGCTTFPTTTTGYARCYLYVVVNTNPAAASTASGIFTISASAVETGVYCEVATDGTVQAYVRHTSGAGVSGTNKVTLAQNQWLLLEVKTVISTTVGIVEWRLDGVVQETLSNQNLGTNPINSVYCSAGMLGTAGAGQLTNYFDDVRVDTTAYCGAGQCLARQGKAGTPTYNAWTKTSSQTAAQVWSATPFSATNNATGVGTTAINQTMLTESFSIPQTGHGTETIGASDTINACKVGLIAKVDSLTNAPTFGIRRRLGGTDTDTAQTLTTADKYFDSSIFIDTLTNLNGSEIGAIRGTSSASRTVTVEDVWLFVDYTPAAPSGPAAGSLALLGVGR